MNPTPSDVTAMNPSATADNGLSSATEGGAGFLSFDSAGASSGIDQDWQMENGEPEKTSDELRQDLTQLEDEINTLKQVLHVKEKKANDIRGKLGITPIQLISDSLYGGLSGLKNIASSETVQKTSENVKYFGNSYLLEGSKNAASYTKSGLSNLSTGMISGMGSIKNSKIFSSMYGFKPNAAEEEKFVEVIAPPEYSSTGDTQSGGNENNTGTADAAGASSNQTENSTSS